MSVRISTTVAATFIVGVVLALAGVVLFQLTRTELEAAVRSAAETRARDIAAIAAEGALPVPLPGRGGAIVARVVDVEGIVLTSSPDVANAATSPPFDLHATPGEMRVERVRWRYDAEPLVLGDVIEPEPAWHIALGVGTPSGPVVVQVVASLEPVEDALDVLAPLLAAILPVVLIITAATVWAMAGRTLRPVEAIRAQAAVITATDADVRVPVPASHDEVYDLAVTINFMLDRFHAAAAEQRRFVADASHELRSPVTAIQTMLEVAQLYPDAVVPRELHADLGRAAARLAQLTDDLLLLARHDEHIRPPRRGAVSPGDVFGRGTVDIVDLLRDEVAAVQALRRVDVHLAVASLPTIRGDSEQLRRAVRNVLDNAVRHAVSGVWVDARVDALDTANGKLIFIRITDDGAGIPSADRERIFERFVRLDEGRARTAGGAGLGLAVCHTIVSAHGGTIRVVDGERGGATIELRLPAGESPR